MKIPGLSILLLAFLSGCVSPGYIARPKRSPDHTLQLSTTGYCKCGQCCGWKRNWLGRPVYAYGPMKGRPKNVGVTASGSRARKGTIAADTRVFPFGTILEIPGYGYGRVEDRGGAIEGGHIDLFFRTHEQALEWGRRSRVVRAWMPR